MKRTIHTIAAIGLLAVPATASAADHELSLELGSTGYAAAEHWALFNDNGYDTLPTFGLRAGFAVHDRVAVIAGWHHGRTGTRLELSGEDYYDESYYYDYDGDDYATMGMAYYANELTLGAKADWPVTVWFHPYATISGVGLLSKIRLDDDTGEDDNLNQLTRTAFAPGAQATGGVEFRIPISHNTWALASHVELGYQYAIPSSYDELGSLAKRGLVFKWGLGARF